MSRRDSRGAVTAELAMALPLLLAVTVAMAWLVSLGTAQVRVTDAARETARAVARGDDESGALAVGRRVAPSGARLSVARRDGRVVVTSVAPVRPPAGLLARWATVQVRAEAVAADEAAP